VRWYCVSREGLATLCKDEADARATARGSDQAWRTAGPHRAVQLVDAAEVERLRARVLELEAVHEDASGAVLQERERHRQAMHDRLAGTVMSKYASKAECEAARAALRNAMLDVWGPN
jgi:hypothetical protein